MTANSPVVTNTSRGAMLQICPHDSPPFGAICRLYARAAATLGLQCHTVFLGPPADGQEPPPSSDHQIHYLNCRDLNQLSAMLREFKALSLPSKFELVVAHRYRSYRLMLAAAIPASRRVVVAHEYGLFARPRRRWLHRLRGRGVQVAGVSPSVRDELKAQVGGAILLPNLVDWHAQSHQSLSREAARQALGLPEAGRILGVVGRLHPKKRPDLALAGYRVLRSQAADIELAFLGDGEMQSELMVAAGDLPIHFCGFVSAASRYLKAFDILLMSSSNEEAFGMVALEAMVAGLPVVSSRAPGPVYVMGDLGHYFFKDTPEAIATAVNAAMENVSDVGDGGRANYVKAAKLRVQRQFSVAALASRLDALLTESI